MSKGAAYAAQGRVRIERGGPAEVEAVVHGSRAYSVFVEGHGGRVTASCTCEHFADGYFCKHVWAALLIGERAGHMKSLMTGPVKLLHKRTEFGLDEEVEVEDEPERRPAKSLRGGTWRSLLTGLKDEARRDPRPALGKDARLWYRVDPLEVRRQGAMVVRLSSRKQLKGGAWSTPQTRTLRADQIERLDPEDRAIVGLMLGAEVDESDLYRSATAFVPGDELLKLVLPRLCRTGRFLVGDAPCAWDAGPSWRVRLRIEGDALRGSLQRGGERMELSAPELLLEAGFLIAGGKASRFDFSGDYRWIVALRHSGSLKVPRKDVDAFLEEAYALPGAIDIDLPQPMRRIVVKPTPVVRILPDKRGLDGAGDRRLIASVAFDYGGVEVRDARGQVLRLKDRVVMPRDRAAEAAVAQVLEELDFRRPPGFRDDEEVDFELHVDRLPGTVAELTARGWRVEAEGAAYRPAGKFEIAVTSGIDWFDLDGGVRYGGELVAFPRLLHALERGQNFVKLGDGSRGLLPEDWLSRQGLVLGTGAVEGSKLRFRPGQALLLDALLAAEPGASADAAFKKVREELARFEGVKAVEPPKGFTGELRPYQKVGLGWMQFLDKFSLGGCLADDMGLGKTVQALALLETRREAKAGPSLVVVPRSLVFNWKAEAAKFAPALRVVEHSGAGRRKEPSFDADVVLTTYGTLRQDAPFLREAPFDYVILDEAQSIKNASSATAKAARLLKGRRRLAMSGTPIENHIGELWSLMEFLNPGVLGSAGVFPRATGKELDEEAAKLLSRALRPFILRRTKEQVAPELPKKVEQTISCELDAAERRRYDELRAHYQKSLLEGSSASWSRKKFHVLEALLRLRQAACHPGLIDKKLAGETSSKLDVLLERVREVVEEGHKALVFSQFTSFLAIVKEHLDREKIVYEYLDGSTRDRQARVERFQSDAKCPLFLISLKAGGLGLNLTAAEYVFLLDPWWNPAVEAQAIDRTHRIGQEKRVFAFRIVARGTVEEKVLELQKSKRDLADAIIQADRSFLRDMTRDDLSLLLS